MMKLGIRTAKARTPVETAAPLGNISGEHPTLPAREREPGQASQPEEFAWTGAGEPYLPRHAADAAEAPPDSTELSAGLPSGRHRR
jgi:hypothetical protein